MRTSWVFRESGEDSFDVEGAAFEQEVEMGGEVGAVAEGDAR